MLSGIDASIDEVTSTPITRKHGRVWKWDRVGREHGGYRMGKRMAECAHPLLILIIYMYIEHRVVLGEEGDTGSGRGLDWV